MSVPVDAWDCWMDRPTIHPTTCSVGTSLTCATVQVMAEREEHPKPLRLFDIARNSGPEISEEEEKHFRECEECPRIVKVFARQFPSGGQQKPDDAA